MISRLRRRILLVLVTLGAIVALCRGYDIVPQPTILWMVAFASILGLLCVIDYRYYRPYWIYAIVIGIGVQGLVYRLGAGIGIHLAIVMLYTSILTSMLLLWMRHPQRYRAMILLPWIVVGFAALIPRDPSPLTPQSVTEQIPTLQLQRDRIRDDEHILLISDERSQQLRSGVQTEYRDSDMTIEYASLSPSDNYLLIHLNTLTTLALAPQSVIDLAYDDGRRSGSIEGGIARYSTQAQSSIELSAPGGSLALTGTGSWRISTVPNLQSAHHTLLMQAKNQSDTIRPSPRTQTTIGASLLRIKFIVLSFLDSHYQKDLLTLYRYQCLVYGQRCDYVTSERATNSLNIDTRDTDLQSTIASGSAAGISLRDHIMTLLQ